MKNLLFLLLWFAFGPLTQANDGPAPLNSSIDNPIELSKKIITEAGNSWSEDAKRTILETYGADNYAKTANKNYILLESPSLVFDYFQAGFANSQELLSKEQFLEILNQAVNSPAKASNELAKASIEQGLREYLVAHNIASKFRETNSLSNEEAITFLDNRFGYNKLSLAQSLIKSSDMGNEPAPKAKVSKKLISRINKIKKTYPNQIPLINVLAELEEFYQLLKEANVGLTAYLPYTNFKNSAFKLNKQRIKERIQYRSSLEITYPTNGTVWIIPNPVEIKWTTSNMDESKTIKFFLTRDDVVIQELGIFKNNHNAVDIKLRRGIPAGDKYKIMGIELYPVNKYHIAKFATPYFTIKKEERKPEEIIVEEPAEEIVDAQVEIQETPAQEEVIIKEVEGAAIEVVEEPVVEAEQPEAVPTKTVVEETAAPVVKEVKKPKRMSFEGRKITYQKELMVENENIIINLYDHGRQDGDIVSIYLNGEEVVGKHVLTYKKKSFEVKLNPTATNDLFLYAHNLGNFPPNTVSIEIKDGSNSENIVLNSDLSSCEAVLINVKQ